jgi:hypothetical protein
MRKRAAILVAILMLIPASYALAGGGSGGGKGGGCGHCGYGLDLGSWVNADGYSNVGLAVSPNGNRLDLATNAGLSLSTGSWSNGAGQALSVTGAAAVGVAGSSTHLNLGRGSSINTDLTLVAGSVTAIVD